MITTATDARAELVEVTAERDALRAQLAGDLPAATRWLQRKVWRRACRAGQAQSPRCQPALRAANAGRARPVPDRRGVPDRARRDQQRSVA